nr:MAG TPA: hypothetical protein [Caudoviricetes sp.]
MIGAENWGVREHPPFFYEKCELHGVATTSPFFFL